jgi:hypothetical protein
LAQAYLPRALIAIRKFSIGIHRKSVEIIRFFFTFKRLSFIVRWLELIF